MSFTTHCLFPKRVYNKYLGTYVAAPCGYCSVCKTEHARRWKSRLELECRRHRYSAFLTLTYDDAHLPHLNPYDVFSSSPTWEKSLSESEWYVSKFNKYLVPVVRPSDISLFFKNLRSKISRRYGLKEGFLRYFVASEYGPTTFRPHYHMLVWFDDPRIYKTIKEDIYTSWPSSASHKSISSFFERNRLKFCGMQAAGYVAGYLGMHTNLPPLLQEYPFRTSHQQSIAPAIGFPQLSDEQVQGLIDGKFTKISCRRPSDGSMFEASLWPSVEDRLFPRLNGFSDLSYSDGIRLYEQLSSVASATDFKGFTRKLYSLWDDNVSWVQDFKKLVLQEPDGDDSLCLSDKFLQSCYRQYRKLLRYSFNKIHYSGYSFKSIYDYYKRKDYDNLCSQLSFQQQVAERVNVQDSGLSYLPFYIDPLFVRNDRRLKWENYDLYKNQFSVLADDYDYYQKFRDYLDKRQKCNEIVLKNTKVRRKKDFLVHHPQYEDYYSNLLVSCL